MESNSGHFGGIILIITVLYSDYLAKNLINNEQKNQTIYECIGVFSHDKNMDNDVCFVHEIPANFRCPAS
ncbi:MAG: hypothetical protein IPN72_25110 [Saprospiraceae bacterium]|nr:hypothetical protein [Saprospiraceae bacterium]